MLVLVAPDVVTSPTGSLGAPEVAVALAAGWRAARPGDQVTTVPLSTGSTGLRAAVQASRGGELVATVVTDPDGAPVPATWLRDDGSAYLDLREVVGDPTSPDAGRVAEVGSSAGAGALLAEVVRSGARRVVAGLGEGAVHDAGQGALRSLTELLPPSDRDGGTGAVLAALHARLRDVELVVAAGTDLPLLGLHGAGAALGRRPGLDAAAAQRIEQRSGDHVARLDEAGTALAAPSLLATRDSRRGSRRPGSGAGGGLGLLLAVLGARVLPGASVVAGLCGLDAAIEGVDVVLTATGVLDGAALADGVPAVVGERALVTGVPVVALGAEVLVSRREISGTGLTAVYPVHDPAPAGRPAEPGTTSLAEALTLRAGRVARTWSR